MATWCAHVAGVIQLQLLFFIRGPIRRRALRRARASPNVLGSEREAGRAGPGPGPPARARVLVPVNVNVTVPPRSGIRFRIPDPGPIRNHSV